MSRCQYGNCDSEAQVRVVTSATPIVGARTTFVMETATRDYCVFHYDEQMTCGDDDPADDVVGDGL